MYFPERHLRLYLVLFVVSFLSGCAASLRSQQPPLPWTTGYWFWNGSFFDASSQSPPVDVLFLHAGILRGSNEPASREASSIYTFPPGKVPPAKEYWLTFRSERSIPPTREAASIFAKEISALVETARKRNLNVVGVQLDIDAATPRLPAYANFLAELRANLPAGFQISITALLDWFREGTQIAAVIQSVDEFVPQFYDLGELGNDDGAIAANIDASRWGPIFARFNKRYRIGISTFGRAWILHKNPSRQNSRFYSHELKPLDISVDPAFVLTISRNEAHELELNYLAKRATEVGYQEIIAGDTIQFVLADPESIREAVENARRMPGQFAGVVFFRWPSRNEVLAMPPTEVLHAGGLAAASPAKIELEIKQGDCAAVKCMEVYLQDTSPLSPDSIRYRIHSTSELEYFLPSKNLRIRMIGPSDLELLLPPYGGRSRLHLGSAVSLANTSLTVERQ